MDTAFQADAFQNDAFQIAGVTPPTPPPPTGGGRRRRVVLPPQEIELQVEDEDWIIVIL